MAFTLSRNATSTVYYFKAPSITCNQILPINVYTLEYETDYVLRVMTDFVLPDKLYGDLHKNAERILKSFNDRPTSTGVILHGNKGSGKTVLAKYTAKLSNLPIIVINSCFSGSKFNLFMSYFTQPIVVIFDEFEKVYPQHKQTELLTLLDGSVVETKKLYIFTCNSYENICYYYKARPKRIYYGIKFDELDKNVMKDYLDKNLINKTLVDNILVHKPMSFDIMETIVEESNRYPDENWTQVTAILNIY
jgi:SpoVK/Ycf46/Vps4 family AAA+-type ATPase